MIKIKYVRVFSKNDSLEHNTRSYWRQLFDNRINKKTEDTYGRNGTNWQKSGWRCGQRARFLSGASCARIRIRMDRLYNIQPDSKSPPNPNGKWTLNFPHELGKLKPVYAQLSHYPTRVPRDKSNAGLPTMADCKLCQEYKRLFF